MSAINLTDDNFENEVLKSDQPVLVDFWAEWCGPCKIQGPVVDEIAKDFEGKAKIAKLEVDESPNTAQKYGIMSIPTLVLFKNGESIWQAAGVQQKQTIETELNKVIS